jgi:hypothetical protein
MPEIGLSGSEGGGADHRSPYPYSIDATIPINRQATNEPQKGRFIGSLKREINGMDFL